MTEPRVYIRAACGCRADLADDGIVLTRCPAHPLLVYVLFHETNYVLFHETNTGHSDASDGYVEAVYATEADAERAKLGAIRTAVVNGHDVYWNPEAPEGAQEGPADWTDDFEVHAHQVHTRATQTYRVTTHGPAGDATHTIDATTPDEAMLIVERQGDDYTTADVYDASGTRLYVSDERTNQ